MRRLAVRRLVLLAVFASVLLVGVGAKAVPASAAGPVCSVSAPWGVPASSLSGTFPFAIACYGLASDTVTVRGEVTGDGQTIEYRVADDSEDLTIGPLAGYFWVDITPAMLGYGGTAGDCSPGVSGQDELGNWAMYGVQTLATVGACFDTAAIESATGQFASNVDVDVTLQTKTAGVGGSAGTDLQYYTSTSTGSQTGAPTTAACDAGYTCGTSAFITNPLDATSSVNSWWPTSLFVDGFLGGGAGMVVGFAFALAGRSIKH